MAVCKECEYYNLIGGMLSKGNCFGHEVYGQARKDQSESGKGPHSKSICLPRAKGLKKQCP